MTTPKTPVDARDETTELLAWFAESGGFNQGTKAPHKWVLRAEQELRRHQLEASARALAAIPEPTAPAQDAQGVPYAYAVYFPSQQREELVHDLDDLLEDMTNDTHTVTELFAALRASSPADTRGTSLEKVPSNLHTFLDAAAGEGLVQGGVDAADLYVELFPKTYAGIVTKEST